jgi:uncharacterized RDD family membrane protein YckC
MSTTGLHHDTSILESAGAYRRDSDGIVTPEAVLLDVETAGYASRILAALLDVVIQLFILGIVSALLAIVLRGDGSALETYVAVALFLVLFGYPIVFETLTRGRTPGKMALSIRAVTVDGAPIRLREAGALFVTLTPKHQRIGDLIAGTMVIRDPEKYVVTPALWFSAPPGLEAYAETIDPTAITVEQYTVVRSFLTRGASLSIPVRHALAVDLATRLGERIGSTPPAWVSPEVFLICAMARYQRRNGPGVAAQVPMGLAFPGFPGAPPAMSTGAWPGSVPPEPRSY